MIEITDLSMRCGDLRMDRVSLVIPRGVCAVLMGTTGCGKTSLLEAIAGIRPILSGSIRLCGREVAHLNPALRGIGYVPQDGALFPTMTVRENIGFALKIRNTPIDRLNQCVEELAKEIGIDQLLKRGVSKLSGGERQRVALARALCFNPEVLLLDEPLSALDEDTRWEMCDLLESILTKRHCTVLHVTHSRAEAERLADFRYSFRSGKIVRDDQKNRNQSGAIA